MNVWRSRIILGTLAAVLAAAEFLRGGYDRVFWLPVSMVLAVLAAFFLIEIIRGGLEARMNPGADLPLLLFAGWAVLSSVSSINRDETLFESSRLVLVIVPYFLTAYATKTRKEARAMAAAIVAVALAQAVYGLYEFTAGQNRSVLSFLDLPSVQNLHSVAGTLRNKNHLAGIVEMGAYVSLGLAVSFFRPKDRSEQTAGRILIGLPAVIMLVALVFSLSRGGWLAFSAALPVFFALRLAISRPALARTAAAALAAGLIIAGFVTGLKNKSLVDQVKTLESIYHNKEDLSLEARVSVWKSAVEMARDRPILGTGWGTFKWAYPAYRRDALTRGVSFAHNDYLQIAAGMGFPGLVFFLLFAVMVFRQGIAGLAAGEHSAGMLPGLMAALFALLVHELIDFNLMLPANAMVFFSIAGLVVFLSRRHEP